MNPENLRIPDIAGRELEPEASGQRTRGLNLHILQEISAKNSEARMSRELAEWVEQALDFRQDG
jgi:hypothetical protein